MSDRSLIYVIQPMVYIVVDDGERPGHPISAHSSLDAAQAVIGGDWQQNAEDEWMHTTEPASIYARRLDYDPIAALRERNECVQAEADRLTMQARRDLGIGYDQSGHTRELGYDPIAHALLYEIVNESPINGSTGYNYCRFCDGAWPDLNGGPEGHRPDCWWLKAKPRGGSRIPTESPTDRRVAPRI